MQAENIVKEIAKHAKAVVIIGVAVIASALFLDYARKETVEECKEIRGLMKKAKEKLRKKKEGKADGSAAS